MTVERNNVIAIATLSDWLKRLAPVFQPMRSKTKINRTMYAWSELQVIPWNCDWFIALSAPVVIGRINCFGFGFSTGTWKPLYLLLLIIIKLFNNYYHGEACSVRHVLFLKQLAH